MDNHINPLSNIICYTAASTFLQLVVTCQYKNPKMIYTDYRYRNIFKALIITNYIAGSTDFA